MPTTRIRYGEHPSQWLELTVPDVPADHRDDSAPRRGTGGRPVVVFVHGGYWRAEHGADQGDPLIADLAGHGWAAVAVEYRRVGSDPEHGGGGWPQTAADLAAALDALAGDDGTDDADDPRRGLDLTRVVLVGHSAGAQLAVWAAARPRRAAGELGARPRVRPIGYVSLGGVLDLVAAADRHLDDDAAVRFLDGTPEQRPEAYRAASPIALLPIGVPGVCLHGGADDRVPYELSAWFTAAARRAGDDCRLVRLTGVDHFAFLDPSSRAWELTRQAVLRLLG